MTLQCATVKNSPSKARGSARRGGSVSLLQNLFFGARLIIRFCVSVPFLRLKSGIKSGCKINILQKNDFFLKMSAYVL